MEGDYCMKMMSTRHKYAKRRAIVALLCVTMLFGMIFTSCNSQIDEPVATADPDATVEVLRLTKTVAYGEKLTTAKFETVSVKASEAWIGALASSDEVVGKYATREMAEGEFLLAKHLSDEKPAELKEEAEFEKTNYGFEELGFVVVTEYVKANTGEDIGVELQAIIDKNPQSVIYFPDGEYQTSVPIRTPADGARSVCLKLSDNAIIKAHENWERGSGAVIRLGGQKERNDIYIAGSNYYLEGGIVDGSGIADGVSIDHGRETSLRDVTIINTEIGVHIYKGANGGSSDADIENIRVFGNGSRTSIGLWIQGWDNTYSYMRIANVNTGVRVESAANLFRNIQCEYTNKDASSTEYAQGKGFDDVGDRNWYDTCSSTNFSTGFYMQSRRSKMTGCVVKWSEAFARSGAQVALKAATSWGCIARSVKAEFTASPTNSFYLYAEQGGEGRIDDPIFDVSAVNQEAYNKYKSQIYGNIVWNK